MVAATDDLLQQLLSRLQSYGANLVDVGEALLREAETDGVFPDDFYSTTNLVTQVRLGGRWLTVPQPGDGLRPGRDAGRRGRCARCR